MKDYIERLIDYTKIILNKYPNINKTQLDIVLLGYFNNDRHFLALNLINYLKYDYSKYKIINKNDIEIDHFLENIYYQIQIEIIVPLMNLVVKLIKEHDPSQAELNRLLGFDVIDSKNGQKDWVTKSLTDRLISQGIIKKIYKKVGKATKFYEVISNNEYVFPEYIQTNSHKSKLANLVEQTLKKYNQYVIKYEEKGKIINKRATRYDYSLYKNDKLFLVIEVDGLQHSQFVKLFHGNIKNFLDKFLIDNIKERYVNEVLQCYFMRIKSENDIEKKLIKFLNGNNIINIWNLI